MKNFLKIFFAVSSLFLVSNTTSYSHEFNKTIYKSASCNANNSSVINCNMIAITSTTKNNAITIDFINTDSINAFPVKINGKLIEPNLIKIDSFTYNNKLYYITDSKNNFCKLHILDDKIKNIGCYINDHNNILLINGDIKQ